MIIYKATNIINNMPYVGQTIQTLKRRKCFHISESKKSNPKGYFARALKKYGIENFDWKVIDTAKDIDELNRLEVKDIIQYNSLAPNGYNLTTGGRNFRMLEETKRKLSEINKGKHLSEETRKKLSEVGKGRIVSEETRKKLSKINKDRHHSEETKKKMSKSAKQKKLSDESKKKMLENLEKGRQYWKGKHLTEDTKKKLSEIHKGKLLSEEHKEKLSIAGIGLHKGSKNLQSKLKEKDVEQIKYMLLYKIPTIQIAELFKVSISAIKNIKYGHCWNYIRIPKDLLFITDNSLVLKGL